MSSLRLISPARRASDRERLAMLPQLEKALKILTEELELVAEHEADLDIAALWAAVEEAVPCTTVAGAVATVEALVPEDDGSAEAAMREKLALRYNTVRPFLSLLGESDALGAAPAGRRILKAGRYCPVRSTPSWCRRCGSVRCSPTPSCLRARSTVTRMWCVFWSSCTVPCIGVMCWLPRRTGGRTRARGVAAGQLRSHPATCLRRRWGRQRVCALQGWVGRHRWRGRGGCAAARSSTRT